MQISDIRHHDIRYLTVSLVVKMQGSDYNVARTEAKTDGALKTSIDVLVQQAKAETIELDTLHLWANAGQAGGVKGEFKIGKTVTYSSPVDQIGYNNIFVGTELHAQLKKSDVNSASGEITTIQFMRREIHKGAPKIPSLDDLGEINFSRQLDTGGGKPAMAFEGSVEGDQKEIYIFFVQVDAFSNEETSVLRQ